MAFGEEFPRDMRMRSSRRGPRMNCRVPVTIEWNGTSGPLHFESLFTRVVNPYGCLLSSPTELEVRENLRITNLVTKQVANGLVVWKSAERPDGWDIGVELISADLNFWGVDL